MRILLARLLVAVTGLVIVLMAAAFALIRNAAVAPPAATSDLVARGRAVYQAQRCGRCHSLGGEGNPAHPLDGVGARLVERDIRKWIVAPQEMNPRVAKRGYALPAGELDALVAYLRAGTAN
ncbi:MAG: cytochrome c [Gemmatimonadota bacterium]|nr:cytochrome c [Gemmatimonadota bacterium]